MRKLFSKKFRPWLIGVAILGVIGLVIFAQNNCVHGVRRYKTIHLGMDAVEKPGSKTVWASPDDRIPEDIDFLVYVLNDESMCINLDCGLGGYFVDCLGGWISGYSAIGDVSDYGMLEAGIDISKEQYVTIADKGGKVIGIYPGAGIKNVPYIMRNHRDLVSSEVFESCFDQLPSRWK